MERGPASRLLEKSSEKGLREKVCEIRSVREGSSEKSLSEKVRQRRSAGEDPSDKVH